MKLGSSVFSYGSSNCFLVRMHNYAGYISLVFHYCVFADESSNGLPERMHNCIGCIYLAVCFQMRFQVTLRMNSYNVCICAFFLPCVFSNVFSKILRNMMQNHIGWICLAFLFGVFSNAASNRPRVKSLNMEYVIKTWRKATINLVL